jgi:hypothetical protein
MESKIGSCVGADGTIFAIRKNLYSALKDYDINDFVIPLSIVKKRFKSVFEEKAFCYEKVAKDQKGEFERQVRITNRTLRAIFNCSDLLNPFKYPLFSFKLLSHKLLKFMVPFLMLTALISNILLIDSRNAYIYLFTFISQITIYLLGWVSTKDVKIVSLSKLGSFGRTFSVVNLAILKAWFQYFQGETYTTWNPNR